LLLRRIAHLAYFIPLPIEDEGQGKEMPFPESNSRPSMIQSTRVLFFPAVELFAAFARRRSGEKKGGGEKSA
jgi:hypothetical protein